MKKKIYIIIGIILITIFILWIVTNYIDGGRVATGHEPKYCIKIVNKDGSKITYWGIGYKVVRYVGISPNEPYESNIGVKMGNWFMKYELPIDSKNNEDNDTNIISIEDFYNTELTQNEDIRNLGKEYSSSDAQKDNCFFIGEKVYNEYLYNKFMEDYKDKKTSFIRVAQNTIEGDLILYDILYYEKTHKIYLVTDYTRDRFSAEVNRDIKLREFEKTSTYQYEDYLFWVLYNGELNDESLKTENTFIITTIH